MPTIIVITVPPTTPPKKPTVIGDKPAVGEPTIADQLRDAADVLDGLPPQ